MAVKYYIYASIGSFNPAMLEFNDCFPPVSIGNAVHRNIDGDARFQMKHRAAEILNVIVAMVNATSELAFSQFTLNHLVSCLPFCRDKVAGPFAATTIKIHCGIAT